MPVGSAAVPVVAQVALAAELALEQEVEPVAEQGQGRERVQVWEPHFGLSICRVDALFVLDMVRQLQASQAHPPAQLSDCLGECCHSRTYTYMLSYYKLDLVSGSRDEIYRYPPVNRGDLLDASN